MTTTWQQACARVVWVGWDAWRPAGELELNCAKSVSLSAGDRRSRRAGLWRDAGAGFLRQGRAARDDPDRAAQQAGEIACGRVSQISISPEAFSTRSPPSAAPAVTRSRPIGATLGTTSAFSPAAALTRWARKA